MTPLLDNYKALVEAVAYSSRESRQLLPQILVASKTQPPEVLETMLAQGHRLFGENQVQEAHYKWPPLKQRYPDCRLHLIGSLQTNKVKQAIQLFDVIETLDRPKLAYALARSFRNLNIRRDLLIQVNTGREPQKSGVMPEDFYSLLHLAYNLKLPIIGLMCIPPVNSDPIPHFTMLRSLARTHGLSHLSMGMSDDYRAAISHGTSWIRIGTALFGQK